MLRFATLLVAALTLGCQAALAGTLPDTGTWSLRGGNAVQFDVRYRSGSDESSFGTDVPLAQLHGLAPSDLDSNGADVTFDLVRDAGTLHCTGRVANRDGGGTFRYAPNARYARRLAALGVSAPTPDEQRLMTFADVTVAFVETLRDARVAVETPHALIALAEHGVTGAFVTGVSQLGYHVSSDELVRLVDHGVTVPKIREFHDLGFRPSAGELVRLADHGVDPGFAREIAALGYHPTADQLTDMVDHGVSAAFARKLASRTPKPSIDDLIRARDAGI